MIYEMVYIQCNWSRNDKAFWQRISDTSSIQIETLRIWPLRQRRNYSYCLPSLSLSNLLLTTAVCKCSYIVTILSRISSPIRFLSRRSLKYSMREARSDKIWSIFPRSNVKVSLITSSPALSRKCCEYCHWLQGKMECNILLFPNWNWTKVAGLFKLSMNFEP